MNKTSTSTGRTYGLVGFRRCVASFAAAVLVGAQAAPGQSAGGGSLMALSKQASKVRETEVKKGVVAPPSGVMTASWTAVEPQKPRTFKAEDLVTVIVREEVKSSSDAKSQQDRDYQVDAKLDDWIRLSHWKLWNDSVSDRNPTVKVGTQTQTDNSAKADRKDSITTRVTARIVDVKPNGILVLEAHKVVKTEEDEYTLVLMGHCRSQDVTPDNTILSTQLHDANISKVSKGVTKDGVKRGWLSKIIEALRPV